MSIANDELPPVPPVTRIGPLSGETPRLISSSTASAEVYAARPIATDSNGSVPSGTRPIHCAGTRTYSL